MANPEEMSAMFPIFVLSLLVLFLLPWTWYRITSRVRHEEKARCGCSLCRSQPKNARTLMGWVKGFLTIGNTITILLWLVALGLVFLIKASGTQAAVFDPYEVLGVSPSASEQEIKQAYRRKSLKYHPDKNPDPEAATYFAEKITKAYKALTDPVMRENYEKYGHPDGQQHMAVGIALPTFMLDKNTASGPLLLALVGLGIIAPLLVCVVYLSSSSKYMGNRVMRSTMAFFQDWMRRKEGLAPSKVMEVILKAEEFYHLGVLRAQQEGLNVLFKEVKGELGLDPKNIKKETEKFWNQYPWMVKANLLVVAQMMRADEQVAPTLKKDFAATLALVPRLLDALMLVSLHPDPYHSPYGYMRASVSVLQFSQCFIQGVPISARKVDKGGSKEDSDAKASLLQLPFLQVDDLKKLARKRVNCLQDLLERPREEQVEILRSLGRMTDQAIDDVIETLAIVPTVDVEGSCQTDQEEAILEGDTVTLRCWVRVSRPKGGMHAFVHSPYYPLPKEEGWWVIFGDSSSNAVYVGQKVLLQDEATALESVRKAMENNPMVLSSHHHGLPSLPNPQVLLSRHHGLPSLPNPQVLSSHHHGLPSLPNPRVLSSHHHGLPSPPNPQLLSSHHHGLPSLPNPQVLSSHHHGLPSLPNPQVLSSHHHGLPSLPNPQVLSSHHHGLPSLPNPQVLSSHHHGLPSPPNPQVLSSHHHGLPSLPNPQVLSSRHHGLPSLPNPQVLSSHHHGLPSLPNPQVLSSHHHGLPSLPNPQVLSSHHHGLPSLPNPQVLSSHHHGLPSLPNPQVLSSHHHGLPSPPNPQMKPDEAASYLLESARTPADVLAKVKAGYRLQEAKFLAPASLGESRPFMLTLHVISDCWIGVEKKITIKLKVGKRSRKGTRGMGGAEGDDVHSDGEGEEEEHDEEADEEEEDYEDEEYSDEEEEEGEGDEEEEDDAGKGKGKGKYSLTQGPAKKKAEGTSSSQQNGSTREANHNDADGQGSDGDADKDDDEATSHVSGQDAENDDDDAESS
eukprot:jgi/Mesvir1/18416/Mv14286-RA.1